MDIDQQYTYSNVIMIQKNVLNTSIAAVYPNPASNMIHIDLNIAKTEKTSIQVLDMTGRLVREFNVTLEKGFSTHQLDLASIANGQYMIRIPISNSVLLSKFTKK
jgi:formylmethanofuran dehydrogenase subunit E-like metal-binding protein